MEATACKRVLIWSGWLRVGHACIGLSVFVLLLSGWLIASSPSLQPGALDLHYLAAAVLVFGLIVRAVLLFTGQAQERWSALIPAGGEAGAVARTLWFYLTLGKAPLPGWYAHNPLWKPVYLAIYFALIILAASGAAMPDVDIVIGFYLPSVHAFWAQFVLWFTVMHIASALMHDYKKQTSDISAMVNGCRVFPDEASGAARPGTGTTRYLPIDTLRKDD